MKFRPYQADAIDALFDYFEKHGKDAGNPVEALPTGTGKSLVIAGFFQRAFMNWPGRVRGMMLTQSKKLVKQNFDTLLRLWPLAPVGIFCDGLNRKDRGAPLTFGTIGSVVRHAADFGRIDLLVIDECHGISPKEQTMYRRFIAALLEVNPFLKVIGLSATPYRLGQGMIVEPGGIFTDVVYDKTSMEDFNQFLIDGYLAPLVTKKTLTEIDISKVGMTGGDLNLKQLAAASDRDEITRAAVREMVERGGGRNHWLIFATGVAHCEHVSAILEEFDVSNVCVHSKMDPDAFDDSMQRFESGKVRAAVNNNILTTGFDMAAIDLIGVLRATMSPGLWVQMLGRGTRPVFAPGFDLDTICGRLSAIAAGPKQNCLVFDFAGNRRRLGPINNPVKPKTRGKGPKGDAPFKICPVPACMVYNHASARVCSECGYEFPIKSKLEEESSDEDLIQTNAPATPVEIKTAVCRVGSASYTKHAPRDGRPPSLLVVYGCGLRKFKEYVCLEHRGFAGSKAADWWQGRTGKPAPASVDEALSRIAEIPQPESVEVWDKKERPEILKAFFRQADGEILTL